MFKITEENYIQLENDYSGICIKCNTVRYGETEGDARNYPCESCEENEVFGISELLIMGLIVFVDEKNVNVKV